MKNIRLGLNLVPFLMAMIVFTGCQISSDEDEGVKEAVTERLDDKILFDAGADRTVTYGSGSFTQVATDGEGNGTVSYLSLNLAVANVDIVSGTVTIVGGGVATIQATKAADGNISAQTDSYILTVATARQSIKFDITNKNMTYAPSATYTERANVTGAIGTGAVEYSSTNQFVATVNNAGEVTVLKGGTATIIVTKKAGTNYAQATASYLLNVGKVQQAIAFTSPTLDTATDVNFSDPNFQEQAALVGTGGSGAITYVSSNPAVATIIGTDGWIDILTAGSTTITATKAADDSYFSATDTFNIISHMMAQNPRLEAGANHNTDYTIGVQNFRQQATGGEGTGAVKYVSSNPSVASIADDTQPNVVIHQVGTATITASKEADTNLYLSSDSYLITVSKATITTEAGDGMTASVGDGSFDQPATPSGPNYDYTSDNHNIATVDGNGRVTVVGTGSCNITATLNDPNYKTSSDTYTVTVPQTFCLETLPAYNCGGQICE